MLWTLFGCAVFNITANLIFIPIYSYTASAFISVFTEFFAVSMGVWLTMKYVGYVPSIKFLPRILISGLAMGTFLFFFKQHSFLILVLSSSAIYTLFLWLTKTITIKELSSIFVHN
jgi:O-antigen/teichoic acid export membrane protein